MVVREGLSAEAAEVDQSLGKKQRLQLRSSGSREINLLSSYQNNLKDPLTSLDKHTQRLREAEWVQGHTGRLGPGPSFCPSLCFLQGQHAAKTIRLNSLRDPGR